MQETPFKGQVKQVKAGPANHEDRYVRQCMLAQVAAVSSKQLCLQVFTCWPREAAVTH
jgi:hypothetical protein